MFNKLREYLFPKQKPMSAIIAQKSKTAILLGEELGLPVYVKEVPENVRNVIRWGSRKEFEFGGIVLNNAKAIARASNKADCRKLLRQEGIPVPEESETEFPVIGRRAHHSGGTGFFICNSALEVRKAKRKGAVYFSKYYPKKNEYRIHVGGERTILVSIKEGDKSQMIWNKKAGFTFKHLKRDVWLRNKNLHEMVRIAKKAVEALELDFAAVDMLADAGQGYPSFVVCEVNTRPALSPSAVRRYARYFRRELDSV